MVADILKLQNEYESVRSALVALGSHHRNDKGYVTSQSGEIYIDSMSPIPSYNYLSSSPSLTSTSIGSNSADQSYLSDTSITSSNASASSLTSNLNAAETVSFNFSFLF